MIKITDKRDCCGCAACVQCCPKRCISLREDEEGFLYPDVNIEECIDCHLCEKVCPWIDRPDKQQPLEVLAVKNRNDEERMASSSGGVFILLAKKVIERGGVVFGAVFSVDCLCHGVPSPGIWRRYLHEAVGGADYKDQITGIEFRNKYLGGWKNFSFLITGKTNDENKVLYSETHGKNAYMRGFLSNLYLRPSCYSCKSKNGASHSDLTLADFWGIDVISPDVYDDKGVSLIIVSSEKGKSLLYSLDVDVYESSLVVAKTMNGAFKEKTVSHPKRKKFFEQFDKCSSVIKLIEDNSKPTFKIRLRNKINYLNQKMIKFKR